jgi:hypothetical protein
MATAYEYMQAVQHPTFSQRVRFLLVKPILRLMIKSSRLRNAYRASLIEEAYLLVERLRKELNAFDNVDQFHELDGSLRYLYHLLAGLEDDDPSAVKAALLEYIESL